MNEFKPLQDRVLVKRITLEKKTKGGIFIPDTAQEKPLEGIVVAVGPGKTVNGYKHDMSVKKGDKILFAKYSEVEITLDNQEYLLLKQDDILGLIK
jgi:chaperonin GroES